MKLFIVFNLALSTVLGAVQPWQFRNGQAFIPFANSEDRLLTTTITFQRTLVNAYPVTMNINKTLPTFDPTLSGPGGLGLAAREMIAWGQDNKRFARSPRADLNYPGNFNMKASFPPTLNFGNPQRNISIILDRTGSVGNTALILVENDDVGNDFKSAYPLIMNSTEENAFMEYPGRIHYGGDEDFYMVGFIGNLTHPETRDIYFYVLARVAETDTLGELYDYAGRLLASDDDGNGNRQFLIKYSIKANTPYFLKVRAWSNANIGNYVLRYSFTPPSKAFLYSRDDYYATETAITRFAKYTLGCDGPCPTQRGDAVVQQYCIPWESCPVAQPISTEPCDEMCRFDKRTTAIRRTTTSTIRTTTKGPPRTRVFGEEQLLSNPVASFNGAFFGLIMGVFALVGLSIGVVIYYRSGGASTDAKQGLYALPPEATFMPSTQYTMMNGASVYGGMDGSMSVYGGGGMFPNMSVYANPQAMAMMNMSVYGAPSGGGAVNNNMSVYGSFAPNPAMNPYYAMQMQMGMPTQVLQPQAQPVAPAATETVSTESPQPAVSTTVEQDTAPLVGDEGSSSTEKN
jgi:hypothetical protein